MRVMPLADAGTSGRLRCVLVATGACWAMLHSSQLTLLYYIIKHEWCSNGTLFSLSYLIYSWKNSV
jgi:hypothetical protein